MNSLCSLAQESLVVISPHRKSIQNEIGERFQKFYKKKFKKDLRVEWINTGGASNILKFIKSRFKSNPKTSEIDLFWGGGEQPHLVLKSSNLLTPITPDKNIEKLIPKSIGSTPLRSPTNHWHSVNLTSFGIFYNKISLKKLKIEKEPKKFEDLSEKDFSGHLSLADPRRSSSYLTIYELILQKNGWKKGWALLTKLAANTSSFAQSSTEPITAVVNGSAVSSICIDYFALAKVNLYGTKNVGFILPKGQTVLNTDPISQLKGAPHPKNAKIFVNFLLGADIQKLFLLPKDNKGIGPKNYIGRLAVNPEAYKITKNVEGSRKLNPFKNKMNSIKYDHQIATRRQFFLQDIFGTLLIDLHSDLKKAYKILSKKGHKLEDLPFYLTAKEIEESITLWENQSFRNKKIAYWQKKGRSHYKRISKTSFQTEKEIQIK